MSIISQITPELLNELFEGRKSELSRFLNYNEMFVQPVFVDRIEYVDEGFAKGTVASQDPVRSVKFARGEAMPLGHASINRRNGQAEQRGLRISAHELDKIAYDKQVKKLDSLLFDKAASAVAQSCEADLRTILTGAGDSAISQDVTKQALVNAQRFSDTSSNALQNLLDLKDKGGPLLILGNDVANALMRHPDFRGSQNRALSVAELKQLLLQHGFIGVWIESEIYDASGIKQAYAPTYNFSGVCAALVPGALRKGVVEELSYLEPYKDHASRETFFPVVETCGFHTADPSAIKVYTNTLA